VTFPLPLHFFTIVLNGEPFIRHHVDVFRRLAIPWHWHVVEGVAQLKHDTAWSVRAGGHIPEKFHRDGRSTDGTTEYLDDLAKQFPKQVTVYRKPPGVFWDGKREMVSAPLAVIREPALLWQIDSDELWTVAQIAAMHRLFEHHPDKSSALFACRFFFGPEICSDRPYVYGNFLPGEWLRVWRFQPGDYWASHEPPRLHRKTSEGTTADIGSMNPFTHAETLAEGLVFQHFAYATEQQVAFKERYYGYAGAVEAWKKLQNLAQDGSRVRNFLPWVWDAEIGTAHTFRTFFRWLASPVRPGATAELLRKRGVMPLAQRNVLGEWRFFSDTPTAGTILTVLVIRADRIGDHILSSGLLIALRKTFPGARLIVVCPEDVRELHEHRPEVDELITFDREQGHRSAAYRRKLIRSLRNWKADLVINPQFSRDKLSSRLTLHSAGRRKVGFDAEPRGMKSREWRKVQASFDLLVPRGDSSETEMERYGRLLKSLGSPIGNLAPEFAVTRADEEFAEELVSRNNLKNLELVAIFPGSAQVEKIFSGYGAILQRVLGSAHAVIALGSEADNATSATELQAWRGRGLNLCGQTTLRQAAALLKRCRLAIGPDTGLSHLACAVGCRHVVIMGGGDFGRFFPYAPHTSIVCLPLECYQCQWRCRYSEPHCIRQIKPEVVAETIRQTMAVASPTPRIFVQSQQHRFPSEPAHPAWQHPSFLKGRGWIVNTI
jgi:ADP-heptose:LPS heptosyltransferase